MSFSSKCLSQDKNKQDSIIISLDNNKSSIDSTHIKNTTENIEYGDAKNLSIGGERLINNKPSGNEKSKVILISIIVISIILLPIVLILKKRKSASAIKQLTRQEHKIFMLLLANQSNNEIAEQLFISLSTVKTHIRNIYKKLNVSSREELKANWNSFKDDLRD